MRRAVPGRGLCADARVLHHSTERLSVKKRLRLLMGATALLYLGPLTAGLAGYGWPVVPVFTAIFVLWMIVMRPFDFPATLADWAKPSILLGVVVRLLVQLALVALCFGIGRGIGGILGYLPPFPLAFPLGISILSIPLSRLLWNPAKEQEMNQFLDEALAGVEEVSAEISAGRGDPERAESLMQPLNGLPPEASETEIWQDLTRLRASVDEDLMIEVLLRWAQDGQATRPALRALMLMGSDGGVIDRSVEQPLPVLVLKAIQHDGALVARFAHRLTAAMTEDDHLWGACPNETFLNTLTDRHPEAKADIQALIALNRSLDPETHPEA